MYLQTVPCDENETYSTLMETLNEKGISNIRECLFRITPEVLVDFHKGYKKLNMTYEQMNRINAKSKRTYEQAR